MMKFTERELKEIAWPLMQRHGLVRAGWTVEVVDTTAYLGRCVYKPRVIELSSSWLCINGRNEVTETILHEIAHALAGYKAGHGPEWKRWARIVGARPERCANTERLILPDSNIVGSCQCGFDHKWYKSSRVPTKPLICNFCKGSITWKRISKNQ